MLKTATLTWNSFPNYGTMLQAYALQQYLLSEGYENHIIDDRSIVFPTSSTAVKQSRWKRKFQRLKQYFNSGNRAFVASQRIYCPKMEKFKREQLVVDYNIDKVLSDKADYDVYICGSDQIWIPKDLNELKRSFFFASFTRKKKIAYAPSLGRNYVCEEWKELLKEYVSAFDCLSVRENTGRNILETLSGRNVEIVVDPTLLLSETEWNDVIPDTNVKERYVLAYILTPNQFYLSAVSEYAKKHNLKLYMFFLNRDYYGKADKLITGGPFDFLSYIKNAEIVFTDSFHGTIFSFLFRTPFYIFRRFKDNSEENQNSRIDTLLQNMDASHLLLDESNCNDISCPNVDFEHIKESLAPYIEKSKKYLQKALYAADL